MWTRELCKNGGCLTSILLFPFKIIAFIFKCIFSILSSKPQKNKVDYFEVKRKEYERMQMLDACSYGLEVPYSDVLESLEYKTFKLLTENPSIGFIQRNYKIGFNRALEILSCLEELGAIKITENYKIEILMDKSDFVKAMNERAVQNEN